MRGINRQQYEDHLRRAEDRLGVDLDWRHYETFLERDFHWHDIPTPATAISLAGIALVIDGCRDLSKIDNIHKIGLGRGFDLLDGGVARWLNQSSDAGALVDAGADKYEMFHIGRAAWQQDAMPKPFIAYVGATNGLHFGLTAAAAYTHPDRSYRPPRAGKHAMFGNNLAGGAYLYANAFEQEQPERGLHRPLRTMAKVALAGTITSELVAARQYVSRILE